VALGLVLAPWVYRNWALYGRADVMLNRQRAMLSYMVQRRMLDESLPGLHAVGRFDVKESPAAISMRLGPAPMVAEDHAATLLAEQIASHPGRYAREVSYALLSFPGLAAPDADDIGRSDVFIWLALVGAYPGAFRQHTAACAADIGGAFRDTPASLSSRTMRRLHAAGQLYLDAGRRTLACLFLAGTVLLLVWRPQTRETRAALVLAIAYAVTMAVHAATLADYDRFSTPFDWVEFLVCLLVLRALTQRASNPTTTA